MIAEAMPRDTRIEDIVEMYNRRSTDSVVEIIREDVRHIREHEMAHLQKDLDKMRDDLEKHRDSVEAKLSVLEGKIDRAMENFDNKFLWIIGGIFTLMLTLMADKIF